MADLRDRVCWSAQTAIATLSTEAVSPSASVFLATHAPLQIRRRHPDLRTDDPGTPVNEEEVCRDFLERSTVNGVLLMPIIGESGTGKSHLVRWIYEQTKNRGESDRRVMIHVPKASTSLRALVNILLDREDIVSEKLTQLRRQVDDLASGMDEAALQRHLVFALGEAVAAADPQGDKSRRLLVGPSKLALVLRDVHVGTYLMKEGALIPRLASSLLNDRGDGESDRPTRFTVDDLPHIADVRSASKDVRELLTLMMSQPRLQEAAADLLTEHLSAAVQAVFKLGGRLQDALLTIREEYQRQGKELVLLIEDFAVIQGLQRDLLDALIEAGVREGRQVLAPVRTLMAVTTGYYRNLAETVVGRVQAATPYVYDLDVPIDPSPEGQTHTVEFVGRYLNAARIGWEQLDAAGTAGAAVPNACDDCKFRSSCHESFGASTEGHGLFPFNWPALRRAIRSTAPLNDAFNPRAVIGRVIRPVLEEADALATGQFPTARFRELFPLVADTETRLTPSVKVEIEDRDALDAGRRTVFLEFWGDAPAELRNLDPGIHEAFGIGQLKLSATPPAELSPRPTLARRAVPESTPSTPPAENGKAPGVVRDSWPNSLRTMVNDIYEWEAGRQPLGQTTALKIRSIVSQAVLNRCDWTEPLTAEPAAPVRKTAWPPFASVVSIDRAAAEATSSEATPIKFACNPRNAIFFQHLLTLEAGVDDPGNAVALRRLAGIADKHQPDLQRAIVRVRSGDEKDLVRGLTASLIGASFAGHAWPGMTDAELVAAAFDDGAQWPLADSEIRTERWTKVWREHATKRVTMISELRKLVGVPRGTGAVRVIDAARVIPLLRKAADEWRWPSDGDVPTWCRGAVTGFNRFDDLVAEHVGILKQHAGALATWLPTEITATETMAAVEGAFHAAQDVALGPVGIDSPVFIAKIKQMKDEDWRAVDQLRRDLRRIETADDAFWRHACIAAAGRDRGVELRSVVTFLETCDEWLTTRIGDAKLRKGGAGEDAAQLIRSVRQVWESIVGDPDER